MPDAGFRVSGAKTVGEFGFLRVERLTIDTGKGSVDRIAVRHPGAVAVLAISDGDVLLIRQYRAPIDDALLEIPAGKLDVEGEPRAEAAARELEEEVGYRPGTLEHVADFFTAPGFSDEHMGLFVATDLEAVPHAPHGPEEEAAEVVAVPIAEVRALLTSGAVEDAKTLIALQWLLLNYP